MENTSKYGRIEDGRQSRICFVKEEHMIKKRILLQN
jgi:hypothetical protein